MMMNKICFCKQELEEDDDVIDEECRMCCRQIYKNNDKLIYTCFNDNCFYRGLKGSGWYFICNHCYNDDNDDNDIKIDIDYENEDKLTFIFDKFMHSTKMISYLETFSVYYYLS